MTVKYSPLDCLKYAAVIARDRIDWATDSMMGNVHMTADFEEVTVDEFECLGDLAGTISDLTEPWVKNREQFWRYSDGRPIETRLETIPGTSVTHVWHPDPNHPVPKSYEFQAGTGEIFEIAFERPSTITATPAGYWQPRHLHAVRDDL